LVFHCHNKINQELFKKYLKEFSLLRSVTFLDSPSRFFFAFLDYFTSFFHLSSFRSQEIKPLRSLRITQFVLVAHPIFIKSSHLQISSIHCPLFIRRASSISSGSYCIEVFMMWSDFVVVKKRILGSLNSCCDY
jgi:hypothetical protein